MAAASLDPRIIVLALGAGVLGFPDVLLDVAGRRRSPLTDIAICVLVMAVVTAQALGGMLLARFVRKAARAGGDAHPPGAQVPRTDPFALVTLVVSLAGAGGLGLLHLVVAGIATEMKSPVVVALATGAGVAVLPCARPLLRVFRREEDHSHGAAVAFLLAVSGGLLYTQRGSILGAAAVVIGAVLLSRFAFPRRAARNAAGAGGRAAPAPTPAAGTRRVGGELTRMAPYLAAVSLVLTATYAPLQSGPDGAQQYP